MGPKFSTNAVNWFILTGLLFIFVDQLFFDQIPIFFLLVVSAFIYYGRKNYQKTRGRSLFWIGIIFIIILILSTDLFMIAGIIIIIYIIIQYSQRNSEPKIMDINRFKESKIDSMLFHKVRTKNLYEWTDVNIQAGIGDTEINVSNTVLPRGESIIFIRNIIGNIKIYVPYDVEVHINSSIVFGGLSIFEEQAQQLMNETIIYATEDYADATRKLKIVTSIIIGDVEVKRI
ncbi:cell wall-active antibiotics response protein LiaF [Bacillus carboniphilus]|uniref:Cell wall-active antibiotics response protein LiaF n=1 Tax=Bacillus carboniphilus TaxID=86663 RepID=A0ABY9JST7_9BACI|nr:cell wall-active antibiotics response protein LiaF [Bacillus carboniphilus]WLR42459.1 cell wall-active antibiotics response protein LiaF [Bacillus carboniphilus]